MKSSKVKSVMLVIVAIMIAVVISGLVAAIVTKTTPKDWFTKQDKPAVETPVEPSDDTIFKAVTGGTYVSLTEEGQGLYINKNIGESQSDKVLVFYGFTKQLPNGVLTKEMFTGSDMPDGISIVCAFILEDNKLKIMTFEDEAAVDIYDYTTKQFGYVIDGDEVLTVKDDGRIIVCADGIKAIPALAGFYIYPMIEIFPEDLDVDVRIEDLWTIEEINAVFSLAPFKAE